MLNNGETDGGHGIRALQGTLTIKNSIIANSGGSSVYLDPATGRDMIVSIDHTDLYQSKAGIAINSPAEPKATITLSMTNSIVTDKIGMFNCFPMITATFDYNDFFTNESQFTPDTTDLKISNMINVDPMYIDPANVNFLLKSDSKAATAGKNQTYLGSQGVKTIIHNWMIQ